MIGVSLYFSDLQLDYLERAIKLGAKAVFTTVVMQEESYSDQIFAEKLTSVMELAKKYQVEVITDISEKVYKKLNITSVSELKELGFTSVRVDSGFSSAEDIKSLSQKFQVYLNGSHLTYEKLLSYQQAGADMQKISVMHNFYPKVGTGTTLELFHHVNEAFRKLGARIVAFVPGDKNLRNPVYLGLPTLEKHRGVHPYVAYLEMLKEQVNDVFIGDTEANLSTLSLMITHEQDNVVRIPAALDKGHQDLYHQVLPLRDDVAPDLYRVHLRDFRVENVVPEKLYARKKGMITLDNNKAGRYEGEINICRKDLPLSNSTNVIGSIQLEYVELLDYLERGAKIMFIPVDEL